MSCPWRIMSSVESCQVVLWREVACHVVASPGVASRGVASRVVSSRVMSCRVVSCRVMPCRVMSCCVVSWLVTICSAVSWLGTICRLLPSPFETDLRAHVPQFCGWSAGFPFPLCSVNHFTSGGSSSTLALQAVVVSVWSGVR